MTAIYDTSGGIADCDLKVEYVGHLIQEFHDLDHAGYHYKLVSPEMYSLIMRLPREIRPTKEFGADFSVDLKLKLSDWIPTNDGFMPKEIELPECFGKAVGMLKEVFDKAPDKLTRAKAALLAWEINEHAKFIGKIDKKLFERVDRAMVLWGKVFDTGAVQPLHKMPRLTFKTPSNKTHARYNYCRVGKTGIKLHLFEGFEYIDFEW